MSEDVLELINQSVRDRFELGWLRGSPESIESLLPDLSADGYAPTLEELVRIDLERSWQNPQADSDPPTVEVYLERFPILSEKARLLRLLRKEHEVRRTAGDRSLHAHSLAERFPQLANDEKIQGIFDTVASNQDETIDQFPGRRQRLPQLGTFGDYELLEQIGAGGMGIVYKARQLGANRIVALKVVHVERPGSGRQESQAKAVERFRAEAQAAAQLEHENVVPVYDVGQVGDKLYFSMRLIAGESLKQKVQDQPLEPRRSAEYLVATARGIAAAHRQGILHRDVKPHNVMIDGSNDRPLVADFGLAKVVEADDQLTRTGEVIGTPSYMPPEQISDAAHVDTTADIYALGATLYHLLTGRPPFQGPNTLATMRQVLYQEPVAPRELNAAIDQDLDTICTKCLQKEPEKRYASADDLAADLQRYLDGKPILARPISRAERVVRWCRRNPLPAALSGVAGMLVGLVFLSVAIGYRETSAALTVAEHNYQVARESVDEFYTEVSAIDLQDAPGMQPLKEKLLGRSLSYYQRLLDERDADAELTAEVAENHFRVGSILDQIGSRDESIIHFTRAAAIQRRLLVTDEDSAALRAELGNSLNALARQYLRGGDLERAATTFRETQEIRAGLAAAYPANREFERKLANVYMNTGILEARRGNDEAARANYDAAQQARRALLRAADDPAVNQDLAKGYFNLGVLSGKQGNFVEAAQFFRQAIQGFEQLLEAQPESLAHRYQLGVAQSMLADALQLDDKFDAAIASYAEGRANLQVLVDENPRVQKFQLQLTTLQIGQAQLEIRWGQSRARRAGDGEPALLRESEQHYAAAESMLREAVGRLQVLVERNPSLVDYRYNLSVVLQMLGDVQLAFNERAAAVECFESALANLDHASVAGAADLDFPALRTAIEGSLEGVRE